MHVLFLYTSDNSVLSDVSPANIFCQPVAYIFILFTVSFAEEMFLIYIKYNLRN